MGFDNDSLAFLLNSHNLISKLFHESHWVKSGRRAGLQRGCHCSCLLISGRHRKMHASRRNDRGRSGVRRAPRKANRAWIAFEERAKSRLVLFPFTTRKGKCLNKRKIKDFALNRFHTENWIDQMEIDSVTKQKAVRERTFKVRLSESEYQLLDANNPFGSIAKLLRQSAVEKATQIHNSKADDDQKIKAKNVVEFSYTKTERSLILELGRIGNNVNQIAKAINTDIAGTGTFDKVKLLHLLISIDQQLRELRPDDR